MRRLAMLAALVVAGCSDRGSPADREAATIPVVEQRLRRLEGKLHAGETLTAGEVADIRVYRERLGDLKKAEAAAKAGEAPQR